MELTWEQKEVIKTDPPHGGVLLVSALAGTGKTYTMFKYAEKRPASILYLAYNKSMADEARVKFSGLNHVDPRTIHSLAFRYFGKDYAGKGRLGNVRAIDLQKIDLVSHTQDAGIVLASFNEFLNSSYESLDDFAADCSLKNLGFSMSSFAYILKYIWNDMENINGQLPVPHDFYLKLLHLSKLQLNYDFILIDEAQDITDCVISIIMNQYDTRKVFVGDPFQQIYGWKNAINSLEKLKDGAINLYLTQSFRCTPYIAEKADRFLQILGCPKQYKGIEQGEIDNNQLGVISRCNATLFDVASELDMEKIPVAFMGGFESYNYQTIVDIRNLLDGKKEKIKNWKIKRFEAKTFETYVNNANEFDLKTRLNIAKKYTNIEYLYNKIKNNVVDNTEDAQVVLTTAHKVKGHEFARTLLTDDFANLFEAISEKENKNQRNKNDAPLHFNKEELHLLYVAVTRARIECSGFEKYYLTDRQISYIKNKIKNGEIILD